MRSTEGSLAIGRYPVDHRTASPSNQFVRRLYSLPLQRYAKTARSPSLGKRLCSLVNLGVAGVRSIVRAQQRLSVLRAVVIQVDALGPVCVTPKPMILSTGR